MIPVVIASVLKPVDEVRIYKRFAISLSKTNKYEINIIGIESKIKTPSQDSIRFYSYNHSGRSLFRRIKSIIQYVKWVREINPKILIVTSPELLLANQLFLSKRDSKWVYDLQEDYFKNITFQSVYPKIIRSLLARTIRLVERWCYRRYDLITPAEKIYIEDIPFLRKYPSTLLLENKSTDYSTQQRTPDNNSLKLIFTGIVSDYSGISRALTLFQKIKQHRKNVSLKIVGHCYQNSLRRQLNQACDTNPQISWIGSDGFVQHDVIIDEISKADLGIIAYLPNPINESKMPSKLYEYTAMRLPFLVQKETLWATYGEASHLGISIDFAALDEKNLLESFDSIGNIKADTLDNSSLWNSLEPALIKSIDTLVNSN